VVQGETTLGGARDLVFLGAVLRYFAHKAALRSRALQQAYASSPIVVLGGGTLLKLRLFPLENASFLSERFLVSEVPL